MLLRPSHTVDLIHGYGPHLKALDNERWLVTMRRWWSTQARRFSEGPCIGGWSGRLRVALLRLLAGEDLSRLSIDAPNVDDVPAVSNPEELKLDESR